jgi:hypothetical protein
LPDAVFHRKYTPPLSFFDAAVKEKKVRIGALSEGARGRHVRHQDHTRPGSSGVCGRRARWWSAALSVGGGGVLVDAAPLVLAHLLMRGGLSVSGVIWKGGGVIAGGGTVVGNVVAGGGTVVGNVVAGGGTVVGNVVAGGGTAVGNVVAGGGTVVGNVVAGGPWWATWSRAAAPWWAT